MPEYEIEQQVEKYWERFERQLSDEEQQKLEHLLQDDEEHFIDPTEEQPVKAVEMARWLDPSPLINLFKSMYLSFDTVKKRLDPRIRFLAYFSLSKRKNIWQAYHAITTEEYLKLGFTEKPRYELLREFIYERITVYRFPWVMTEIDRELRIQLKQHKILLGEKVFQDATDARSLKHDKEAKYSGYYKESGYKIDVTIDAGHEIPLQYIPMEITADEGTNLVPSQEHLATLGITEKERIVDDKYATYENIAYSEQRKRVSLFYKISKNWVYNKDGVIGEIEKRYQRYHQEKDFVPGADLEFMLQYLLGKNETEIVGALYRNQRMAEREENPEGYDEKCNERGSRMEGFFGRVKTTTILDDHPGRRGWKWFLLQAGLSMLSLVFAALIRVQQGVLEHLTNVTYII
jgi:hypothetical protein